MLKILQRYVLTSYLKVFLLCNFSFIAILLVTRLREIARFASLTSDPCQVLLFTLYQIPHILPFAIPISCLISSILLFQRLSQNHELTAMRSSGISIPEITFPLLIAALIFSFGNFFICSELTTRSHLATKQILAEVSIPNPIELLKKQNLSKMKSAYVNYTPSEDEKKIFDLWLIEPNKGSKRLNVIYAQELELKDKILTGKNITFFTHTESPLHGQFDSLILENQEKMATSAQDLSFLLKTSHYSLSNPVHLPLPFLLVKKALNKDLSAKELGASIPAEITKRLVMGFSAFTFTFLGLSFGMELGRKHSKKNLFIALLFAASILLSFILGKTFKYNTLLALLVYIIPQPIAILASFFAIKKISRGIE